MPRRILRLSFAAEGDPADPGFSAELIERATLILLLQQRWGDPTTWLGEYIPTSLEAVREFNQGWDLYLANDPSAPQHFERAATQDTAWLLPAALYAASLPMSQRDSLFKELNRRAGLRAGDRETVDFYQVAAQQNWERYHDLASRRFRVMPEVWLSAAVNGAFLSQRSEAAIRYFQYADSVHRARVAVYRNAAYAMHDLGSYDAEVKVAARLRERFPEQPIHYRTVEIMARTGLGDLEGVRRVVAEAEASPEQNVGTSGSAGTRTWIAAIELMAHGRQAEGREMLDAVLPVYRRLREENGPAGYAPTEVEILLLTDRLAEARTLALEALPGQKTIGDSVIIVGLLGQIAALEGKRDQASQYSAQLVLLDRPQLFGYASSHRAKIAARLGDREGAVRFLEAAREAGTMDRSIFYHRDPAFATLRGYTPFEQLRRPRK
jgi:tetratricopeptide (TPR) repeat protein